LKSRHKSPIQVKTIMQNNSGSRANSNIGHAFQGYSNQNQERSFHGISPGVQRNRNTTGIRDRSESNTSGNTYDPFIKQSNSFSAMRFEKATEWTTTKRDAMAQERY